MAKAKKKAKSRSGGDKPWERDAPRGSGHTHLTAKKKSAAKRRAKKAGRKYPNLVDNMRAAAGSKGRKSTRRKRG